MRTLLIAAAVTLGVPAHASEATTPFDTGNSFIRKCDEATWQIACASFVLGVFQGSQITLRTLCLRPGVDNGQLVEITKAFIRNHPESADSSAVSLALASWRAQFACQK